MEQVLYTVAEVAKLLKINKNTVYDLIKNNILVGLKLGSLKVTKVELTRFLETYSGKDLSNLDDIKEITF